jgi:dihydrofolate synthase/folylpolyglutamate synthase
VVKKELSVITPIGLDHQNFLGNSVAEIARTKLNSMDKKVLLGLQIYDEVYDIAKEIAIDKKAILYKVEKEKNLELLHKTQQLDWAYYLYENTKLAVKALDILALPYQLKNLKKVHLFGRFYELFPNVIIDVGHNLLATKALVKALETKYNSEKIILVYNSLDDKDYKAILSLFKPLIKRVEIIKIETNRAVKAEKLEEILKKLEIEYKDFMLLNKNDKYFIFGSFYVVEAFLEKIEHSIKNI